MSNKIVNDVMCPLADRMIEIGLCMDIQDVVDDMVIEDILEPDISFKLTDEHKKICRACKKRIDLSL